MNTKRFLFSVIFTLVVAFLLLAWKIPSIQELISVDGAMLELFIFAAVGAAGICWLLVVMTPRDAIERMTWGQYKEVKKFLALSSEERARIIARREAQETAVVSVD